MVAEPGQQDRTTASRSGPGHNLRRATVRTHGWTPWIRAAASPPDRQGYSAYGHVGTGHPIRCGQLTGVIRAGDRRGRFDGHATGWPRSVHGTWAEQPGATLARVRTDQHVSWPGPPPADPRALIRTAVGWAG